MLPTIIWTNRFSWNAIQVKYLCVIHETYESAISEGNTVTDMCMKKPINADVYNKKKINTAVGYVRSITSVVCE